MPKCFSPPDRIAKYSALRYNVEDQEQTDRIEQKKFYDVIQLKAGRGVCCAADKGLLPTYL